METFSSNESIAEEILREQSEMEGVRSTFDSHYEEIAERMFPQHKGSFQNKGEGTQGEKRNDFIFDSTAAIALGRFAAILDSLLTPANQTWHRLVPSNPNLRKDRSVKLWFEEANQALFKYRYAPRANFVSQNQQDYKSLGAYGTASLYIDKPKDEKGLIYRSIHLAEFYIRQNFQGMVDTQHRKFQMSARQCAQRWGASKLPERIKEALEKKPEQKFWFVHCVRPRHDRDLKRVDYKGMPFANYVISVEEKKLMEEGGFNVFPYATSRYEQAPGEDYGRSPAMDILPANKTLNEMKKTMLKHGHRAVDPIYLMADDGVMDVFSAKPGAMVSGGMSPEGRKLVDTLPVGNLAIGKDLMDDERQVINDAFLVTLFQILVESPTMTATEVLERTKEKGILLAPTVGRQRSERNGPMIDREIDLLMQQNLLAPMPPALREAQGEYRIEYDSLLSRTQRAEEAAGLMRTLEMALQAVNVTQNPEPMDHFNWDIILPEVSDIQGVPARWMRSMEQVAAIREGRGQQQEMQQMAQVAPGAAALIKSTAMARKV